MSEPDAEPTPLSHQRLVLQRRRARALYQLVISSALAALWLGVLVLDGNNLWRVLGVVLFAIGAIVSVIQFRNAARSIRTLEERSGAGA